MNLFVERNPVAHDVTLTLSVDNPAVKTELKLDDISSDFDGQTISIICTSGTPLFQIEHQGEFSILIAQGTCILLHREDNKPKIQLFDESAFGSPIYENNLSEVEMTSLLKAIAAWVSVLTSI